ncbi:MAG: hypothetical protein JWM44_4169 [Bacilli bacterium]|nr:hypothetical protein [Bacilli bacterium]
MLLCTSFMVMTIVVFLTSCNLQTDSMISPSKDIVASPIFTPSASPTTIPTVTIKMETPKSTPTEAQNKNQIELQQNDTGSSYTPTKVSQSTPSTSQNLDSWVGDYIFTEDIDSKDYTKFYEVFITKEKNDYSAKITTDDSGVGVYSSLQAKINGDRNHIDFILSGYSPYETNTSKPYNPGDHLLGFTKTDTGFSTHWGKIVPANDTNKVVGTYFKIRENSEGYVGHWYTSIPHTGGNSTTIKITELTKSSISFHLYITRTYSYDGVNIKLENNIAKFVDNNNDDETIGTIELSNNKLIVNIEKTNIPILHIGRTVFNYKVSEFKATHLSPNNAATEVDLGKGIEIDFDRRISPTLNPTAMITKANVPSGSEDGYVEMNVKIKGNKLIFLPDYDAMKLFHEVIESGQKYQLAIDEGYFRDDVGNINSGFLLEFTTK